MMYEGRDTSLVFGLTASASVVAIEDTNRKM